MTHSLFLDKLETDYIPTDEDVSSIREIIEQQSTKLSELALEVSKAEKRYYDLLERQGKLENMIQGHRRLIYPSRRNTVPVDIWREIFYHCLPTTHDAIMHHREPPSLLTQVCKSWRDIALSTPKLWASAHIPVVDIMPLGPPEQHMMELAEFQALSERRARGITRWLGYAASSPLSLTIGDSAYLPYPDMLHENTQAHILLKAVLPVSKQWQNLRITVTSSRIKDLAALCVSDLAMLETLDIENILTWEDANGLPMLDSHRELPLFQAPNLRRVKISQMTEDIASFPLPWHQLTHLSLNFNDYPKSNFEIVSILKSCPRIVYFRVLTIIDPGPRLTGINTLPPQQNGLVTLPDFKTLEISDEITGTGPSLFDGLSMPALDSVSFFIPCPVGSPLLSLLRQCTLISLNTNPTLFKGNDFLNCLKLCPSLRHLFLSCTSNFLPEESGNIPIDRTDTFLQMLSVPDDSGFIYCPRLEEIQITTGVADYTDRGVLEFIKMKQAGTHKPLAKLKSFKISFPRSQTVPMADEVRRYVGDGLDLVLSYMDKYPELDRGAAYRNLPIQSSGLLNHFDLRANAKVF